MRVSTVTTLALFEQSAWATMRILARQSLSNTANVYFGQDRGAPKHLASGILYGITDVPRQIPDHFYQEMGFNYARIGGAQLDEGGWIMGPDAYAARFDNTRDNYQEARRFGAPVIILPHDIWGTDHANSSTVWPGDNGDWTNYDEFLDRLISDLKSNDMLEGLIWDIWNEPDGSGFWNRPQSQYLDLYVRTHQRLRRDTDLNNVLISGPSSAGQPSVNNGWWTAWIQRVVADDTIPDQYTWHDEPGDPAVDNNNFKAVLQQHNAPSRTVNINEYATFDQQIAAGAAWWISRLERYDFIGLRGNWLSKCQLRDFLASLLTKQNTNDCSGGNYAPNGEYQVYKYYNLNMTGVRAHTEGTEDGKMDVYSTVGSDKVRVLCGVLEQTGTWYITLNNLSALGLPESGSLLINTWGFSDAGHFDEVDGPSDRGSYSHDYTGNSVTFPVFQTDQDRNTAWGFEFAV